MNADPREQLHQLLAKSVDPALIAGRRPGDRQIIRAVRAAWPADIPRPGRRQIAAAAAIAQRRELIRRITDESGQS